MLLPNAEHASVEREKISGYLLSTTNPRGRSKALFFSRFGFELESWEDPAEAFKLQVKTHEVVRPVETPYGSRYYVDGIIDTPEGRNPLVRTVRQFDQGTNYPRLITAHLLRE